MSDTSIQYILWGLVTKLVYEIKRYQWVIYWQRLRCCLWCRDALDSAWASTCTWRLTPPVISCSPSGPPRSGMPPGMPGAEILRGLGTGHKTLSLDLRYSYIFLYGVVWKLTTHSNPCNPALNPLANPQIKHREMENPRSLWFAFQPFYRLWMPTFRGSFLYVPIPPGCYQLRLAVFDYWLWSMRRRWSGQMADGESLGVITYLKQLVKHMVFIYGFRYSYILLVSDGCRLWKSETVGEGHNISQYGYPRLIYEW